MRIVVCYDIVDDNKRRRLAERLERFITRVQKSVFEGDVDHKVLDRIRKIANKEIDHTSDSVRIYFLCKKCMEGTEVIGCGPIISPEKDDYVV